MDVPLTITGNKYLMSYVLCAFMSVQIFAEIGIAQVSLLIIGSFIYGINLRFHSAFMSFQIAEIGIAQMSLLINWVS